MNFTKVKIRNLNRILVTEIKFREVEIKKQL